MNVNKGPMFTNILPLPKMVKDNDVDVIDLIDLTDYDYDEETDTIHDLQHQGLVPPSTLSVIPSTISMQPSSMAPQIGRSGRVKPEEVQESVAPPHIITIDHSSSSEAHFDSKVSSDPASHLRSKEFSNKQNETFIVTRVPDNERGDKEERRSEPVEMQRRNIELDFGTAKGPITLDFQENSDGRDQGDSLSVAQSTASSAARSSIYRQAIQQHGKRRPGDAAASTTTASQNAVPSISAIKEEETSLETYSQSLIERAASSQGVKWLRTTGSSVKPPIANIEVSETTRVTSNHTEDQEFSKSSDKQSKNTDVAQVGDGKNRAEGMVLFEDASIVPATGYQEQGLLTANSRETKDDEGTSTVDPLMKPTESVECSDKISVEEMASQKEEPCEEPAAGSGGEESTCTDFRVNSSSSEEAVFRCQESQESSVFLEHDRVMELIESKKSFGSQSASAKKAAELIARAAKLLSAVSQSDSAGKPGFTDTVEAIEELDDARTDVATMSERSGKDARMEVATIGENSDKAISVLEPTPCVETVNSVESYLRGSRLIGSQFQSPVEVTPMFARYYDSDEPDAVFSSGDEDSTETKSLKSISNKSHGSQRTSFVHLKGEVMRDILLKVKRIEGEPKEGVLSSGSDSEEILPKLRKELAKMRELYQGHSPKTKKRSGVRIADDNAPLGTADPVKLNIEDFRSVILSDASDASDPSIAKSVLKLMEIDEDDDKDLADTALTSTYHKDLAIEASASSSSSSSTEDSPDEDVSNNIKAAKIGDRVEVGRTKQIEQDELVTVEDATVEHSVESHHLRTTTEPSVKNDPHLPRVVDGEESSDEANESKASIVDSVSLESELEGYESASVPYVVRMLDRSCAWLEGEDYMACGNYQSKPSLLKKVNKQTMDNDDAAVDATKNAKQSPSSKRSSARNRSSNASTAKTGTHEVPIAVVQEIKARNKSRRQKKQKSPRRGKRGVDIGVITVDTQRSRHGQKKRSATQPLSPKEQYHQQQEYSLMDHKDPILYDTDPFDANEAVSMITEHVQPFENGEVVSIITEHVADPPGSKGARRNSGNMGSRRHYDTGTETISLITEMEEASERDRHHVSNSVQPPRAGGNGSAVEATEPPPLIATIVVPETELAKEQVQQQRKEEAVPLSPFQRKLRQRLETIRGMEAGEETKDLSVPKTNDVDPEEYHHHHHHQQQQQTYSPTDNLFQSESRDDLVQEVMIIDAPEEKLATERRTTAKEESDEESCRLNRFFLGTPAAASSSTGGLNFQPSLLRRRSRTVSPLKNRRMQDKNSGGDGGHDETAGTSTAHRYRLRHRTVDDDNETNTVLSAGGQPHSVGMNEEDRLAALELTEKLRRRAATLKRRRKMRDRRRKQLEEQVQETE